MIKTIKDENFKLEIQNGITLVDFYADWCGPCKMMNPVINQISEENQELKILKVNIDKREDLAREYGIMSIPTVLLIKDGKVITSNVGFTPKETIDFWLKNNS